MGSTKLPLQKIRKQIIEQLLGICKLTSKLLFISNNSTALYQHFGLINIIQKRESNVFCMWKMLWILFEFVDFIWKISTNWEYHLRAWGAWRQSNDSYFTILQFILMNFNDKNIVYVKNSSVLLIYIWKSIVQLQQPRLFLTFYVLFLKCRSFYPKKCIFSWWFWALRSLWTR